MGVNKKGKSVLEQFEDLSSKHLSEDLNAAKEFLQEFGIDPDEEGKLGEQAARRVHFLAKAAVNETRDKSLLDRAAEKVAEIIKKNSELAGQALKNALGERQASFQFRNLETWSEEDIKEVLTDMDLAGLMEEFDQEDNEEK